MAYSPEEIRDMIINELTPYFDHKKSLNKFVDERMKLEH